MTFGGIMDEKDIMIDPCYIIGTALLFRNSLDREFFDRVGSRLSVEYDVDLSEENVFSSVNEWPDFFRITGDNRVILTKEAILNKTMVRFLFSESLEEEVYQKVVAAILNKKIEQSHTKILRFPK